LSTLLQIHPASLLPCIQVTFLLLFPNFGFLYRCGEEPLKAGRSGGELSYPRLEVRQLHAPLLLAEEMNFTRAADRLNVSQPALSKLVTELEEHYGLHLFKREKGRLIELTDAGQIFIEEARAALSHAERAIQLARAAQEGIERILMVGHSPHCDQSWISTLVGIRLPLYPRLRIRLMGQFPTELVRCVIRRA
jgi:DNA-binding transcriptional LysR family regulator